MLETIGLWCQKVNAELSGTGVGKENGVVRKETERIPSTARFRHNVLLLIRHMQKERNCGHTAFRTPVVQSKR